MLAQVERAAEPWQNLSLSSLLPSTTTSLDPPQQGWCSAVLHFAHHCPSILVTTARANSLRGRDSPKSTRPQSEEPQCWKGCCYTLNRASYIGCTIPHSTVGRDYSCKYNAEAKSRAAVVRAYTAHLRGGSSERGSSNTAGTRICSHARIDDRTTASSAASPQSVPALWQLLKETRH